MFSCSTLVTFCALAVASAFTTGTPRASRVNAFYMADIVDTAVGAGSFKTLVAAVSAAGLAPTLKGPGMPIAFSPSLTISNFLANSTGPFTVFAPTDEAFAKLPPGTVEALLNDIPKLTSILTYHVVPGAVKAETVVTLSGKSVATVNGKH